MNELSELLVSASTDTVSAKPIKLSEQLLDNVAVQGELERRKLVLDQLTSNVQTLKQMMTDAHDTDAVKGQCLTAYATPDLERSLLQLSTRNWLS